MPKVHFKSPLEDVTVEVPPGTTLLDAAEKGGAQVGPLLRRCVRLLHLPRLDSQGPRLPLRADGSGDGSAGHGLRRAPLFPPLAARRSWAADDVQVEITEESLTAFMDENPVIRRQTRGRGEMAAEEVGPKHLLDEANGGIYTPPPSTQRTAETTQHHPPRWWNW